MRDTRARLTVTTRGMTLADVAPVLDAKADAAFGPGRWHQHGSVRMDEVVTYGVAELEPQTLYYEATMDVIATDEDEVDGL